MKGLSLHVINKEIQLEKITFSRDRKTLYPDLVRVIFLSNIHFKQKLTFLYVCMNSFYCLTKLDTKTIKISRVIVIFIINVFLKV